MNNSNLLMENLIEQLHEGGYSCVIAGSNGVRTFTRRGVADLYDLLLHDTAFLKGASVADKVIGKAAAALMILGGVSRVYTDLISEHALSLFQEHGIEVQSIKTVPYIINRDHTGWCPLESASRNLHTPQEILLVIENFIKSISTK